MEPHVNSADLDGEVRVGVDVCRIAEVADAIDRFGPRYLDRVYTAHEVGVARTATTAASDHLAVRFAAKEATVKVLRPDGSGIDWRTIEVVRHPGGWCGLRLTGSAAELARRSGISSLSVSMSHEAGLAVAVVVGLVGPVPSPSATPGGTSATNRTHTTDERVDVP
jgi:holo-[acyl-carrier protein] synthase